MHPGIYISSTTFTATLISTANITIFSSEFFWQVHNFLTNLLPPVCYNLKRVTNQLIFYTSCSLKQSNVMQRRMSECSLSLNKRKSQPANAFCSLHNMYYKFWTRTLLMSTHQIVPAGNAFGSNLCQSFFFLQNFQVIFDRIYHRIQIQFLII